MSDHPQKIGKYEVEQYLGGGMSHVYKARDPLIGKTVAIKILTAAGAADEDAKARFLREAKVAASVEHENIASIFDFGSDGGQPYIVMEFVRGEDLRTAIASGQTGDFTGKTGLALQAAKAVEYIHGKGIVHRDIKPENIRINRVNAAGTVKLIDFGIAKTANLALTREGFTLGTPYYMAPEQVRGKDVTPAADVYAFGILLFELMTGAKPFAGDTIEQIFFAILQQPVDLEVLRRAGIPEPMCALIAACTEKEAADRPAMAVVRERLENMLPSFAARVSPQAGPRAAAPAQPAQPTQGPAVASAGRISRRKWLIAAGGAAGVLGIAYPVIRMLPSSNPDAVPEEEAAPLLPATLSTPSGDMVLIPGGSFLIGRDRAEAELGPFYIDRTEVTNEAFELFCRESGRPLPAGMADAPPRNPVVNVTFTDAQQFAAWAGKRLPLMREWEKAARGVDGRAYPWGDNADAARANVADNPENAAAPRLVFVDTFAHGQSPFGVLQMAGNVWEWVDHFQTPSAAAVENFRAALTPVLQADEPWYVIMGGAYDAPLPADVTFEWASIPARFHAGNIGFRCVRDVG